MAMAGDLALPRPVRALLLDLDGTLLADGWYSDTLVQASREVAATHPGLDAARLAEANGSAWDAYWPRIEERWTLGKLDGASVRLEAWRRTLRRRVRD